MTSATPTIQHFIPKEAFEARPSAMPFQARVFPLQHPPDPFPISLVELAIGDARVRTPAPARVHPASEVSLELLHLFLKAGTALPPVEIDVAAGAGGLRTFRQELRFVYFAEPDQMGFVEVVRVCTHVEVVFGVLDVALAHVGSYGSVVCREFDLVPQSIGEPAPVPSLAPFTQRIQISVTEYLVAG